MEEQSSGLEESCVFVGGSREVQIYLSKVMMRVQERSNKGDIRCLFFFNFQVL